MTTEKLLVAVDFSDTATRAAKWAIEQFAPGAELTLVHVIEPPDRPRFARDKLPPEDALEAVAREYAIGRMTELSAYLAPAIPRTEIRVGKPHEQVAAAARESGATLVVIGPHGDRPRPSKFLGTTADRIVRTCPVPVLVVTNPSSKAPARILVPVDDDEVMTTLLSAARDLAERFDGEITLLHVWSNAIYSHVASMSYATERTEAAARKDIEKELTDAAAYWLRELGRTGIERSRVTSIVEYGKAGDVVIETAASIKAELIVLGRRGSGLVAPALLGSTVGTVLHSSHCPVLVITEPARARG
jgi:nucleotide-binding universal stress UspA family protein